MYSRKKSRCSESLVGALCPRGDSCYSFHVTIPVKRFAQDVVQPRVREMDENEMMDPDIVKGLFEQGVSPSNESYSPFLA